MAEYILLIQNNETSLSTAEEWENFLAAAHRSGLFQGGSEMGKRWLLGNRQTAASSDHIVGYMRFDTGNRQQLLDLLAQHPVVVHGGTIELCELPRS